MKRFLITIVSTSLFFSGLAVAQDAKSSRRVATDKQSWSKAVGAQLQRRSNYVVSRARMEGIAGELKPKIGFKLSPDGTVSNIHVIESSGNDAVDKIASGMPEMDRRFPAFSPDMGKDPISLVAPIILHLAPPPELAEDSNAMPPDPVTLARKSKARTRPSRMADNPEVVAKGHASSQR